MNSQQIINHLHNVIQRLYLEDRRERIFQDIRRTIEKYQRLIPTETVLTTQEGSNERLISIAGSILVTNRGVSHHIHLEIFIPLFYPDYPPICYVRPPAGMQMVKNYKYFNSEGQSDPVLLQNWNKNASLVQFIDYLSSLFAIELPITAVQPLLPTGIYQDLNSSIRSPSKDSLLPPSSSQSPPPAISSSITAPKTSSPQASQQQQYNQNLQATKTLLEKKIQNKYATYYKDINQSINLLFDDDQAKLKHNAAKMDHFINTMNMDIQNQKQAIQIYEEHNSNLQKWILEESEGQSNRSIDSIITGDPLSEQQANAVAEDVAYEDCMFTLRQALHENKISLDNYLKQIRTLARAQFFSRALSAKILLNQSPL